MCVCTYFFNNKPILFITEEIQKGSEAAFERAYKQYGDQLYGFFLSQTGSSFFAEELLQQTFVKLWVSRENLSVQLPLNVQLFRIARSLFIDHLRRRATERAALSQVIPVEADNSLEEQQEAGELQKKVNEVVNLLPPVGQKAFRLSREDGLTYHQIAEQLSISPKTVEYHISRALGLLKKNIFVLIMLLSR